MSTQEWVYPAPKQALRTCTLCASPIRDAKRRLYCGDPCRRRAAFWRAVRKKQAGTDDENCATCARGEFGPTHNGSSWCESGSIASGGTRAHCTCDECF